MKNALSSLSHILERLSDQVWWVESLIDQLQGKKAVNIGGTGFLNLRPFHLRGRSLQQHKHVIGTSGYGKSNLLATYFCELVKQGVGCALIDPHADLGLDILHHLLDIGFFDDPASRRKLLYIDFGNKDTKGHPAYFLPFNVLKQQPFDKYTIARNFVETCRRVWPYLSDGAPVFENILLYSVLLLIDNSLPLTELEEVLSNREYRAKLLRNVPDQKVVSFFQNRYDQWGREAPLMRESTLNKISLLTFSPVLRYSLSQRENVLDFRRLMDEGVSVIFNLAGLDSDTQKFLGSLLSIGFETAALSREDIPSFQRREYHLIIDEFSQFSASSEQALSRILDLARKYRLGLTLSHQSITGQISERIKGALQNTITISFRLGRTDAEVMAKQFGQYESHAVKHHVSHPQAIDRVHPLFYTPVETYETWAIELERLFIGECYVKQRTRTEKVKTHRFPPPRSPRSALMELEASYTRSLMVPKESLMQDTPCTLPVGSKGGERITENTVFVRPRSGKRFHTEETD